MHPVKGLSNCDGYKPDGISFPSSRVQAELLKKVYAQANVDPKKVCYLECHGTGTQVGDLQETTAVTNFFFDKKLGRDESLLVGSTKSNMGHPEPASGLSSMCKLIVTAQSGVIPKNLHYKTPNPKLEGNSFIHLNCRRI